LKQPTSRSSPALCGGGSAPGLGCNSYDPDSKVIEEILMISLAQVYGNNLFYRKDAYRKATIVPLVSGSIISLLAAFVIVKIFDIRWEYAFLKVCGILLLLDFGKQIAACAIDKLNYKLFLQKIIRMEVLHYLNVFNLTLDDDNSGCIEDYLLAASFDKSLDTKMNLLAAMNYSSVVALMSIDSKWDGYYYRAWTDVIDKYMEENPDKIIRS
jgi:hypothetical protein